MLTNDQVKAVAFQICELDGQDPERVATSDSSCGVRDECDSETDYFCHYYQGTFDVSVCWHVPYWRTLISEIRAMERQKFMSDIIREQADGS